MYTSINKNIFIALAQSWMQVMLPRLKPKSKDSVQETTHAELEFAKAAAEFWLQTHLLPNGLFAAIGDHDLAVSCTEYMTWSFRDRLELATVPKRPTWLLESYCNVLLPTN